MSACDEGGTHPDPGPDPGPGTDPGPAPSAALAATDDAGDAVTAVSFADADRAAVRVVNRGTGPSKPLAPAITGITSASFTIDPSSTCIGRTLGMGESCTIDVRYARAGDALDVATLVIDEGAAGGGTRLAVELDPGPSLRIEVEGGAPGELIVIDLTTFDTVATCLSSCSMRVKQGQRLQILAATPSVYAGLSGACTTTERSCQLTIDRHRSMVTATFSLAAREQWAVLTGGSPITSAAFDSAGNLVVADAALTKRSPAGAVVWTAPIKACTLAVGPGDTIYLQTASHVMKLQPDGTTAWSQPLDPHAVGCGSTAEGFVHNLAVGADGAVAIHGNTGVARWDGDGHLSWAKPVTAGGLYGVAIDPQGVVEVAVLSPITGESTDVVRLAADGTPLDGVEDISSQYHGMFVVTPSGSRLATSSGHSRTYALGQSVRIDDADYAPTGICAAGDGDVAWIYQHDDLAFPGRSWTLNRYHADDSLAWTVSRGVVASDGFSLGTVPLDVAGASDGRIAVVGAFGGERYMGGWIAVLQP